MAESNEVQAVEATPVKKDAGRGDVESTRGETYVTPDVDIYETDNELVLVADIPGVAKDSLELKIESRVLEITGHRKGARSEPPVYSEFSPTSYYRAFNLTDRIDPEKINAALQDGVLTVALPKMAHAKPRKIEIMVG